MKSFNLGQKFEFHTETEINGVPRYTLISIDSSSPGIFAQRSMGVFVVALGQERELDIFSDDGQARVLEQAPFTRLVIVILGRGHKYSSIEQIQEELNGKMNDLAPKDCSNRAKIPYMATTRKLHLRETVFEDDELFVEDYCQS